MVVFFINIGAMLVILATSGFLDYKPAWIALNVAVSIPTITIIAILIQPVFHSPKFPPWLRRILHPGFSRSSNRAEDAMSSMIAAIITFRPRTSQGPKASPTQGGKSKESSLVASPQRLWPRTEKDTDPTLTM
jgi:hypothetical protein